MEEGRRLPGSGGAASRWVVEDIQSLLSPDMTLTTLARFRLLRSLMVIPRSDPLEEDEAEGEAGSMVVDGISTPR